MEVFGLGLKIKEEGAATVQAAVGKLNAELNRVTSTVANTGRQFDVNGKYAAKAAINVAELGARIATTGTISGNMATKILTAGSTIASMFGPAGIAVAALGGFAAAAIANTQKASDAIKKTEEDFRVALQKMADTGDVMALTAELKRLEQGTPFGRIEDDVVNTNDGLLAMKARLKEIQPLFEIPGFTKTSDETKRLRLEIESAERRIKQLRAAIVSPAVGQAPTTGATPITVTARDPNAIAKAVAKEQADNAAAIKAVNDQYIADSTKAFNQRFDALEQEDKDFQTALGDMMAQHARDSAEAFAYQMDVQATQMSESIRSTLGAGVTSGIQDAFTSGIQAAISSGKISDAWKAMGQAIIQNIASAMAQVALKALNFAQLMASIQKFMVANPIAAVVAATALLAFAYANGGKASSSNMTMAGGAGGLSYGAGSPSMMPTQQIIFGQTSATTAAGMTPRSATNVTIIGPNDPSAQRAMQELLAKADSRGRLV